MIVGGVDYRLAAFLEGHRRDQGDLVAQFNWVCMALMRHSPAYSPFDRREAELNSYLMSSARDFFGGSFYHGGIAGLSPGEELLPRSRGAFEHPDSRGQVFPAAARRLVFVSQSQTFAMCFAVPLQGDLYEVEPDESLSIAPFYLRALRLFQVWIGESRALESFTPGCLLEFSCKSATVLKVCNPVHPDYAYVRRRVEVPACALKRVKSERP